MLDGTLVSSNFAPNKVPIANVKTNQQFRQALCNYNKPHAYTKSQFPGYKACDHRTTSEGVHSGFRDRPHHGST